MKERTFYFFLFSFVCFISHGQVDMTQYFDAHERKTHRDKAVFYRKISKSDTSDVYIGTEYWMDGHVKCAGYAFDSNFVYKTGEYSYYYTNGTKSGQGQFYSDPTKHVFSLRNRKWETWYPSGKPKEVWIYKIASDFASTESFLMSFWDSTGITQVIKGEGQYYYTDWTDTKDSIIAITFSGAMHKGKYDGVWLGLQPDSKKYSEDLYHEGIFASGNSFDAAGKIYTYDSLETAPRFVGGEKAWNIFINSNSQPSRNAKLQANISVRFRVARDGATGGILEIHTQKDVREEIARIIKLMPKFIPATTRGQPVDSYYTAQIPVALTY